MSLQPIHDPGSTAPATRPHSQKRPSITIRHLLFSFAAMLLLGLFLGPIAVNAQPEPIQPAEFVDTDGDGLSDADEATYETDPTKYDTDGDGFGDNQEVANGSDPRDESSVPANAQPGTDTDGDLLSDIQEEEIGTDPTNPDTDGDGLGDGDELEVYQTDALNLDTDGDGFTDGYGEVEAGTDPLDPGSYPGAETESTLLIDVRILTAGYQGNDFAGDSEPLPGVDITFATANSDVGVNLTTDGDGRVAFPGLGEGNYLVALGIPGDFADFITVYGNDSIPEPRRHEGQNTNTTVVYIAPGETLYGTFYVIPADARGDDPAPVPSPAPQPQQPAAPVKALPSTGSGVAPISTKTGVTLALIVSLGAILATMGVVGLVRRRA